MPYNFNELSCQSYYYDNLNLYSVILLLRQGFPTKKAPKNRGLMAKNIVQEGPPPPKWFCK
jgi:hypothetical protein